MEEAPKIELKNAEEAENAEKRSDWRDLKEQSIVQAQTMIDAVEGFSDLGAEQQADSLEIILSELVDDNNNRFTAEVIALQLSITRETARHESEMEKLGVAA